MKNVIINNLDEILKDDKKRKIIIIVGIILIAIIFLSSILENPIKEETLTKQTNESNDLKEYKDLVEQQILDMIKYIDGVGRVKVMVTLESTEEVIYQYDSTNQQTEKSSDVKEQVVIIDDENGNDKALVRSTKLPKIQGVVVVCDGAENVEVEYRITNALKTALGLGSNEVCVVLYSKTEN